MLRLINCKFFNFPDSKGTNLLKFRPRVYFPAFPLWCTRQQLLSLSLQTGIEQIKRFCNTPENIFHACHLFYIVPCEMSEKYSYNLHTHSPRSPKNPDLHSTRPRENYIQISNTSPHVRTRSSPLGAHKGPRRASTPASRQRDPCAGVENPSSELESR